MNEMKNLYFPPRSPHQRVALPEVVEVSGLVHEVHAGVPARADGVVVVAVHREHRQRHVQVLVQEVGVLAGRAVAEVAQRVGQHLDGHGAGKTRWVRTEETERIKTMCRHPTLTITLKFLGAEKCMNGYCSENLIDLKKWR